MIVTTFSLLQFGVLFFIIYTVNRSLLIISEPRADSKALIQAHANLLLVATLVTAYACATFNASPFALFISVAFAELSVLTYLKFLRHFSLKYSKAISEH